MKTLLIVYHSMTSGTQQLCEAVRDGAERAGEPVRVRMQHASETGPDHVLAADAYVFASPENLAAISGLMKDFFDRCYYPVLDKLAGRPVFLLVCAGTDGSSAIAQMQRICTGWRLREVMPAKIVLTQSATEAEILAPKRIEPDARKACAEAGLALAIGLSLGVF